MQGGDGADHGQAQKSALVGQGHPHSRAAVEHGGLFRLAVRPAAGDGDHRVAADVPQRQPQLPGLALHPQGGVAHQLQNGPAQEGLIPLYHQRRRPAQPGHLGLGAGQGVVDHPGQVLAQKAQVEGPGGVVPGGAGGGPVEEIQIFNLPPHPVEGLVDPGGVQRPGLAVDGAVRQPGQVLEIVPHLTDRVAQLPIGEGGLGRGGKAEQPALLRAREQAELVAASGAGEQPGGLRPLEQLRQLRRQRLAGLEQR